MLNNTASENITALFSGNMLINRGGRQIFVKERELVLTVLNTIC